MSNNSKNFKVNIEIDVPTGNCFETNDFDLRKGKIPTLSTIKAQIKSAEELLDNSINFLVCHKLKTLTKILEELLQLYLCYSTVDMTGGTND